MMSRTLARRLVVMAVIAVVAAVVVAPQAQARLAEANATRPASSVAAATTYTQISGRALPVVRADDGPGRASAGVTTTSGKAGFPRAATRRSPPAASTRVR